MTRTITEAERLAVQLENEARSVIECADENLVLRCRQGVGCTF